MVSEFKVIWLNVEGGKVEGLEYCVIPLSCNQTSAKG